MPIEYEQIAHKPDGFGVIGRKLEKYIPQVEFNSDEDVAFYYNHPDFQARDERYSIMYMPWESTKPRPGWMRNLLTYEEVWVPSPFVQKIVQEWGYDAYVYEHGMDSIWSPKKRQPKDKLIFLFQGFEALRKGAREAIHAFNNAFRGIDDVELWIKTKTKDTPNFFPKIKYIEGDLSVQELVDLYHSAHVMVAPTWGEGFGIPSRDAMGTGMPLIHTRGIAPYERFMHNSLIIDADWVDSPWPKVHPGQMLSPNVDHLIEIMRQVYDNYDFYSRDAFAIAGEVHQYYNWTELTNDAFFALEQRLR